MQIVATYPCKETSPARQSRVFLDNRRVQKVVVVDVVASISVWVSEVLVEFVPHLLLSFVHIWQTSSINLRINSLIISLRNT